MNSTIVRDSIVGDDWIKQTADANPIMRKLGADGQPTGDIITGPVRLAFIDQLVTPKQTDDGGSKYSADLLFTPLADFTIFYEEYWKWCGMEFSSVYNPHNPQNPYPGLHSPFKQQAEKAGRYGGFTPGCVNITCGTHYMPSICDVQGNPIVDLKRLYAGMWAICAVKPYAYGKAGKTKDGQPMKKGIGFGLQSIMIIGDDTRFGGGPVNAKEMFSNVKVSAPIARPDMGSFPSGPVGGAPGVPAAAIPGYTAPGGSVPTPGQQPFQMQQTVYSPQPQPQAPAQGFIPPGVPAAMPGYNTPTNYATAPATSAMTTSPSDLEEMRAMGLA